MQKIVTYKEFLYLCFYVFTQRRNKENLLQTALDRIFLRRP